MAHTPGPWALGEKHLLDGDNEQWGYTLTAVGGTLAERAMGATFHVAIVGANPGDCECEANAHLIAAAPELLYAARIALTMMGGDDDGPDDEDLFDVWHKVRSAIAKAEGRSE